MVLIMVKEKLNFPTFSDVYNSLCLPLYMISHENWTLCFPLFVRTSVDRLPLASLLRQIQGHSFPQSKIVTPNAGESCMYGSVYFILPLNTCVVIKPGLMQQIKIQILTLRMTSLEIEMGLPYHIGL
jgi:hypothetical protein